jgi:hypothetical protein
MPTTNGMTVLLNPEDTMSSTMFSGSNEEIEPEPATVEASWPHRLVSASASATGSSIPPPIVLEATPTEGTISCLLILLRSRADGHDHAATTTVTGTLLALYNAKDYLIVKHPKVVSTVSTVLTTVGGIILFPGVSTCARGTILAHPAVGRRLRRALNAAAALAAAQAQASGQVAFEDVDDYRRDEPDGLLSVEFVV